VKGWSRSAIIIQYRQERIYEQIGIEAIVDLLWKASFQQKDNFKKKNPPPQQKKIRFGYRSKPDFTFPISKSKSEGKTSPVIELGFFGFATALLARFLVIATGTRFAQRAFTIQLLLETP
jgi:hypothetical protein